MSKSIGRACPVCLDLGPRSKLYRQQFGPGPLGDGYIVCACEKCGTIFADGIATQAELDTYYAEKSKYAYEYASGAESSYDTKRFEIIADQLESSGLPKTARVLDVGCATGGLLNALKRRGFENVSGTDPSPACSEAAMRLYGIRVVTLALADHAELRESFDLITLVGVLEHLRDLNSALAVVASLLAPGGLIYCAQPDAEGFGKCVNAPFQQFSTEHVNFFTRRSLNNAFHLHRLACRRFWQWHVEWRQGVTDSVISALYLRSPEELVLAYDETGVAAVKAYVLAETEKEKPIKSLIHQLIGSQLPIVVWGVGTLTRHLIATTDFRKLNIVAFVDSAKQAEEVWMGRPLLVPSALSSMDISILISSVTFKAEITSYIRDTLKLPNPIIELV